MIPKSKIPDFIIFLKMEYVQLNDNMDGARIQIMKIKENFQSSIRNEHDKKIILL